MTAIVYQVDPVVYRVDPLIYGEEASMHATYGPRIQVHPDRTGAQKSVRNRLIVLHTSEGSEGADSAEAIGSLMTRPGDRPGSNGPYGASYHFVADTDRILPAVPTDVVAYSAAGANHDGIHVCLPGRAGQTREQWLDPVSYSYIVQTAALMKDLAAIEEIPLVRRSVAEVQAGAWGYCDHDAISKAYGRSDHWDLGPEFPWGVLFDLLDPHEEDDMEYPPIPPRAYDSRPDAQAFVDPTYAQANANVPKTPFAPGEVRKVFVALGSKACYVKATAIGNGPGYVAVSGAPGIPKHSTVNLDPDGVESDGHPVGLIDGHVYVYATASCDVAIDVFGR